jgi:hypothetical protein
VRTKQTARKPNTKTAKVQNGKNGGKLNGKGKQKKEGPKRASAFILFSEKLRPKIKAKSPDATFGELAKAVGAEWKGLSDAAKAEWTEKAKVQTEKNAKAWNKKH